MPMGSEFSFKLQGNLLSDFLWQSHLKCFIGKTSRTAAFLCLLWALEVRLLVKKNKVKAGKTLLLVS